MPEHDSSFYRYYLKELSRLETGMGEFARAFPASASHLGMGHDATGDPHVRLLVESMAFIAAQLHLEIDRVPGEYAYQLVQSLCPAVLRPLPCMSVVQFVPAAAGLPVACTTLPAAMQLVDSRSSRAVRFEVAGAPRLWPFSLETFWENDRADTRESPSTRNWDGSTLPSGGESHRLVIRLAAPAEIGPREPDTLDFFVGGTLSRALAGVEALLLGTRLVAVRAADGSWQRSLDGQRLYSVADSGLSDAGLDPHEAQCAPLSQRVQEWLTHPRAGCFVRATGIGRPRATRAFELVLEVDDAWRAAVNAVREHLTLNCAVIGNVFSRAPMTIPLEPGRTEYRLPEWTHRREPWEVHRIARVRLLGQDEPHEIPEWDPAQSHAQTAEGWSWSVARARHVADENPNPTVRLRLVRGARARPYTAALVEARCVQRNAPERLTVGSALVAQAWDGPWQARLLASPTPYGDPVFPTDEGLPRLVRALQWTAIPDDVPAFRNEFVRFLKLHERRGDVFVGQLVDSLRSVRRELVALPGRVVNGHPVLGMGAHYHLEFDASATEGGHYFIARLIRTVLEQTCDLNTPIELTLARGRRERIHVR